MTENGNQEYKPLSLKEVRKRRKPPVNVIKETLGFRPPREHLPCKLFRILSEAVSTCDSHWL